MLRRTFVTERKPSLYYDFVRKSLDRAHPDDRARAVLRAARHAVQRVPPHPRAHRARPPGRSRHVSVRPATCRCRGCGSSAACGRRSSARVKIGPSLAKIPLDALLDADRAAARARRAATTPIHSHEEGGLIGVVLAALLRVPHLYDMHSSLPQQLTNFAFSRSRAHPRACSWRSSA